LHDVNPHAAKRAMRGIDVAANRLLDHQDLGVALDSYLPQNVRSLIAGDYEIRYEVFLTRIYIVRVWHSREDR